MSNSPALIHALRSHKDENGQDAPIYASGEGGNPLTDSPAVQLILSLLAVADHPGDTVARFHVAHSPLGPAVGLLPGDEEAGTWKDDAGAWKLATDVRAALAADGYGPTIHGWVRSLAPDCGPRDFELARRAGFSSAATLGWLASTFSSSVVPDRGNPTKKTWPMAPSLLSDGISAGGAVHSPCAKYAASQFT